MSQHSTNLSKIIGPTDESKAYQRPDRVVDFSIDPAAPHLLQMGEACDDFFGVDLNASNLAHLIYFLQRRLADMAGHVESTSVPIVHLSSCCGWPRTRDVEVVGDVTWTTTRCGKCDKHLATFADRGTLDIGLITERDPS